MVDLIQRFERLENLIVTTQKNTLNIDEVCLLTGLAKSTIYKKVMRGETPHYKQAGHLYFDRVEIENWLKSERGFLVSESVEMKGGGL